MSEHGVPHEMTIAELWKVMDSELKQSDILAPNSLQNLSVFRDGKYIGYIDFAPHLIDESPLRLDGEDDD